MRLIISTMYPLAYFVVSFVVDVVSPKRQHGQKACHPLQWSRLVEAGNRAVTERKRKKADTIFLVILASKILSEIGFTDAVGKYHTLTFAYALLEVTRSTINWMEEVAVLLCLFLLSVPFTGCFLLKLIYTYILFPLSSEFIRMLVILPISLIYTYTTKVGRYESRADAVLRRLDNDISTVLKSAPMQDLKAIWDALLENTELERRWIELCDTGLRAWEWIVNNF
mmetsp:Transcript_45982/g.118676  ORF Transcript_45982/g.118676 Transcript_45982/m.118676 type:complete len:225 (-) Transcript_45982:34-708(-)